MQSKGAALIIPLPVPLRPSITHTHTTDTTHTLMPSYKVMPRRDDHLARAYGQPTALVHVHLMVQSTLSAEKHETAERLFRKRQLVDLDERGPFRTTGPPKYLVARGSTTTRKTREGRQSPSTDAST